MERVTILTDECDTGKRTDVCITERSGLSRSKVRHLIDDGHIVHTDGSPVKPSAPIERCESFVLSLPPVREPSFGAEDIPLSIVYEDDRILVVDKPSGMVVHPGRGNYSGTLASALLHHCRHLSTTGGDLRPGIVHRLDRETSGLLVVALDNEVHVKLSKMLKLHEIKRIYTAFVWGRPVPDKGTIVAPLGRNPRRPTLRAVVEVGCEAETDYETVECYDFLSKLSVSLKTGRTHQIRVHLAHIGHHVFGDPDYGGREERLKGFNPDIRLAAKKLLAGLDRQALHAGRLSFAHPITGKPLEFVSPLPPDLARLETALHR